MAHRTGSMAEPTAHADGPERSWTVVGRTALRFAPAIAAYLACAAMLLSFDTPLSAVLLYSLYVLVASTIPGTLLWRMLRPSSRSFVEEVAAGTTFGLCVQAFLTWVLMHVGAPRLAMLWAVGVVVACIAHPRLRRLWRSSAEVPPMPAWTSWAFAVLTTVTAWWVANNDWRSHVLAPIPGRPGEWFSPGAHVDVQFQQGITAMVMNGHDRFPNNAFAPLEYQLMVYEHMADASRWTGIDLSIIIVRLHTILLLALAVLLCAIIAHRITKSPWGAVLGGAFAYLTNPPPVWADVNHPIIQVAGLNLGLLRSSTQTFGQPIFHLLILLTIVAIAEKRFRAWHAVAFAGVAFVAGGAKATFLPQLLCALAGVLVVGWLIRSGRSWRVVAMGALTAAAFVLATLLILGTGTRDLTPSLDVTAIRWTSFAPLLRDVPGAHVTAATGLFLMIGWSAGAVAAIAAVVLRRKDLGVWLLAGISLSGFGGSLLAAHPALSHIWFLRGAWPILGTLAGIGLYELVKMAGGKARHYWIAALSLVAGIGLVHAMRFVFVVPTLYQGRSTWIELFAPYVVILNGGLLAGAVGLAVHRLVRRGSGVTWRRSLAIALLVAVATMQGTGLAQLTIHGITPLENPAGGAGPAVDPDGAYAARWVRENSSTNDTIATNMHCVNQMLVPENYTCDARSFWLGALSERQVLLEGWSYAPAPRDIAPDWNASSGMSRFWAPEILTRNDEAIATPTATSMEWLREHSVDWIVVNRGVSLEGEALRELAELVLERGDFAVYRVQ